MASWKNKKSYNFIIYIYIHIIYWWIVFPLKPPFIRDFSIFPHDFLICWDRIFQSTTDFVAGVREDVAVVQSGSRGPQAQRGVNGVLFFFPFLCHLAQLRLRAMAKVARVSIGILAKWDPYWRDPSQICQWNSFKEENSCFPVFSFSFLVL